MAATFIAALRKSPSGLFRSRPPSPHSSICCSCICVFSLPIFAPSFLLTRPLATPLPKRHSEAVKQEPVVQISPANQNEPTTKTDVSNEYSQQQFTTGKQFSKSGNPDHCTVQSAPYFWLRVRLLLSIHFYTSFREFTFTIPSDTPAKVSIKQ